MCNWYEGLTKGQIARQIVDLILAEVAKGLMISRKAKDIRKAIFWLSTGHYLLDASGTTVTAYAETMEHQTCIVLRSVVVNLDFRSNGLFGEIVQAAIEAAWHQNPDKLIILACHPSLVEKYEKLGFAKQDKAAAPTDVWSGRTFKQWVAADREWMSMNSEEYFSREGESRCQSLMRLSKSQATC